MKRRFYDLLEYALARAKDLGFLQQEEVAAHVAAANARRHVLGFVEIGLLSTEEKTVRLHLWRKGFASMPVWPVHDHCYALTSLVVAGRLQDRRYSVVPEPGAQRRLYEVRYGSNGSRRVRLGRRVRCIERRCCERGPGETYRVPAGTFHSTVLPADGAAAVTIVQTGRTARERPRVVGAVDGEEVYEYITRRVDGVMLDEWAGVIINELRLW